MYIMSYKKTIKSVATNQEKAAQEGFLEDWFHDYYRHRLKVYHMNFIRGIMFGFGSVIGGTVMIALLLWLLTFFNDLPFIGHFTQTVQNSIQQGKPQNR